MISYSGIHYPNNKNNQKSTAVRLVYFRNSRNIKIAPQKKLDSVDQRQLFSAVGQAKLINRYYELFREHGSAVGHGWEVQISGGGCSNDRD